MKQSLIFIHILPFILWYLTLFLVTIVIDYVLHLYQLKFIGYYLGFTGTFTIILSFIYSARKRRLFTFGSPGFYLNLHEVLAWIGSLMLLVHAGVHFNALLPWLGIFMLLIVVAFGFIGKILLKKAKLTLKDRKMKLLSSGLGKEDMEKKLFADSIALDVMKKWRSIHIPISLILVILAILHIITILYFRK